jgi:hypothetical protein
MSEARTPGAGAADRGRRVGPALCLGVGAVLAALWLLDLFVLKTPVLSRFEPEGADLPPLTPMYAFWRPALTVGALAFVAVALRFVLRAPRWTDPERTTGGGFALRLALLALLLPMGLFAVRQALSELGTQLEIYPNEEVYYDALRIVDYPRFLEGYVAVMPRLSLHGQHFPPGHASLLYAVAQVFGRGVLPVAGLALACTALASLAVWRALARIRGEVEARQGALLLLAAPSVLDFACTSMDAVFLLPAALVLLVAAPIVSRLHAGDVPPRPQRLGGPLLLGLMLFVATCFSFSTLPLGLMVGLAIDIAGGRAWPRTLETLGLVGASYAAAAVALRAGTDFSLWACLGQAQRNDEALMRTVVGGPVQSLYARIAFGNSAALLIGCGVAVVAAVAATWRGRAPDPAAPSAPRAPSWNLAILLALAVMAFGGLYTLETERIWLFAVPWLIALAMSRGPLAGRSLQLLLALGCAQALLMEWALFTLW